MAVGLPVVYDGEEALGDRAILPRAGLPRDGAMRTDY
jgi:hypothetical protein